MADSIKVINRVTGKLESLPLADADRRVAESRDYDYPSLEEIDRLERVEQFGSTAQQAVAATETVGRTATFGAWQGFGPKSDIEARRRTLAEESPGVQFVAQGLGATIPAIASGGVATGAVGTAALGARGAQAAGVLAEGIAGGLADEVEQAALDQREVSPGRAMLVGVGGELVGRAIPAAIRAGAGKLARPNATAAIAGETVEDISEAVGAKAQAKLADEAPDMPAGPDRDRALAATADLQRARASEVATEASKQAQESLAKIADDAPAVLAKSIDGTAPAQIRWAAETAARLRELADAAPEAQAAVLREHAGALLEARTGKDIWRTAADARRSIREMRATERATATSGKAAPTDAPAPAPDTPAAQPPARTAPLDDVRMLDSDGMLERVEPDDPRLQQHAPAIAEFAESGLAGRSLEDLGALPLDSAESAAKVKAFAADEGFRREGMLASNMDRARGGLPAISLEPGGKVYLSNGRHRLTAARESGQEYMIANVKSYDADGNTLWDYVGPVRVNQPGGAPSATVPAAAPVTAKAWVKVGKLARAALSDEQREAWRVYQQSGYQGVNRLLRNVPGRKVVDDDYFRGIADQITASLDEQVARGNVVPGTVYREVNGSVLAGVKPGSEWSDPGILSAGREYKAAQGFDVGDSPVVLEIRQRTGVPNLRKEYGRINQEQEVLLRPNTKFRVLSEETQVPTEGRNAAMKRPVRHLVLEEVSPGAAGSIKRTPKGARVWEPVGGGAPDFSEWDPSDFARGRGGSKAAGKTAEDYSGGATLSTYQRSIVDGLAKNPGFRETGRVTGDAGKLGSEPTFHIQPDGSVKLTHGRLRITAAREIGRDTVYGRVVKGAGKKPQVVFEGQVRVGRGPRPAPEAPPAAAVAPPAPESPPAIAQADELLASGQTDVGVWGRAGEGAADLQRAASAGPGGADPVSALEDQVAAAERWQVGKPETRAKVAEAAKQLRAAEELAADTERAVAGRDARALDEPSFVGAIAGELGEYALERAVGMAVPGAGLALRVGKRLWRKLDDQGKAQIARVARALLSPLTSQGRWGAARSVAVMTALDRFKGESPDARAAYESRRQLLTDVAANPQLAGEAMATALGGLAKSNPSNYVALARRMTESLQYVATHLPPTVGISLAYPTGVPITDSELRDVAELWNTAFDPATALEAVARREASPIQMQTLRELHPDIYADLQRAVINQAPSTFAQLDSQTKLSIDIMFGSDGVGGLFATSEAARYVAQGSKRAAVKPDGTGQLKPGENADTVESAGIRAVRSGVTNKGAA